MSLLIFQHLIICDTVKLKIRINTINISDGKKLEPVTNTIRKASATPKKQM